MLITFLNKVENLKISCLPEYAAKIMKSILKHPSAWVPIVIPFFFFAYIVMYITIFGIVREADEGTGAHLFQLWLALEPLMVGFFAIKLCQTSDV
jgi:hypothetical protein